MSRPLRLGALLLALLFPRFAAGDGDSPRPAPRETRIVPVGAITSGFTEFYGPRGGVAERVGMGSDEDNPMFGWDGEESIKPYGTIDEVLEIVRSRDPMRWAEEGTWARAPGTTHLVLHAPKDLLDAAEALVGEIEQEVLRTLVVDLLALEGDPTSVGGPGGVAAAIGRGDVRIVGAARATGHPGQRVTAVSGLESAFVADQDVEVAEAMQTADPIVETALEGLGLTVRATETDGGLRLDVQAWFSRMESLERLDTAATDAVERPTVEMRTTVASLLAVEPDAWKTLGSSGRITFAVRAGVRRSPPSPRTTALPSLGPADASGPLSVAARDLSDLAQKFQSTRGSQVFLCPSNFTPPEPPELPEPVSYVHPEVVEELARTVVDPDSWARAPAALSRSGARLELRADAAHLAAVDALLAELRRRFLRICRVDALVLSVPASALPAILAADGDAVPAVAGARVEARSSVRLPATGGRQGVDQGLWRRYVGDFDVEIADKATIGNPIVKSVFEGVVLDVAGISASGGSALDVELRFDRSTWLGARRVRTRHGDVECPRLGIQTARGDLVVPIGGTRLASIALEGDRATLVYLSAAVE